MIAQLTDNIAKFFAVTGKTQAVVGISGGVDSAVTAALCARALGAENVTGVLLPHADYSSADNFADAQQVVTQLGIANETVQLAPLAAPIFALPWVADSDYAKANTMSRLRAVVLYSLANARDALNSKYTGHDPDKIMRVIARLYKKEGHRFLYADAEPHARALEQYLQQLHYL